MKKYSILIVVILFINVKLTAQNDSLMDLDINLLNYQYPFPVKYVSFLSQGETLNMAFMDNLPDRPNGKTIMLFHGKNFNGAYWEETAKALTEEGFRVIIPDQIGFGKSSKPVHFQYSFQELAMNTKRILDTLGVAKIMIWGIQWEECWQRDLH